MDDGSLESLSPEMAEIIANEALQLLESRIWKMAEQGLREKFLNDLIVLAGDAEECQKVAMLAANLEMLKAEIESISWLKVDATH